MEQRERGDTVSYWQWQTSPVHRGQHHNHETARQTNKILDSNISITATAVRLPISGGHSESINLTLENQFKIDDIKSIIKNSEGVILEDNPSENLYPMPLSSQGKDEVYVGRVRRDNSCENSLNMWVVSDNLRKGAATNTIQIIKLLVDKGFIN